MQETWVWPLVPEDPLEKGMVTHSSIFAWRISYRGAWWATAHGVTKSQTLLSDLHHTYTHTHIIWIYFTHTYYLKLYYLPISLLSMYVLYFIRAIGELVLCDVTFSFRNLHLILTGEAFTIQLCLSPSNTPSAPFKLYPSFPYSHF